MTALLQETHQTNVAYFEGQLRLVASGKLDIVNLEQAAGMTGKSREWWMNRAAGLYTAVILANGTTFARKHNYK